MTKAKVKPEVLAKLRAVIANTDAGRVQRGISWPSALDEAVNAYIGTAAMERSTLVQIAVAQYLEFEMPPAIAMPLPKAAGRRLPPLLQAQPDGASARGRNRTEYVPIESLEMQAA